MAVLQAGIRLTAQILLGIFGVEASDTQNTVGTTTATSYTPTLTSGTACACTFTVPTSGKVRIHNSGTLKNSTTARSTIGWQIRSGGSIGAGTVLVAVDDNNAISVVGSNEIMVGRAILVTGLAPGLLCNIQQQFKNSGASTGTFDRKHLIVEPCLA